MYSFLTGYSQSNRVVLVGCSISTNFGHTKFDFQISFNRADISRDRDKKYIEELAIVTMTPEYAKALLMDFARVLKNYEDEFGEIALRPHILKQAEENK